LTFYDKVVPDLLNLCWPALQFRSTPFVWQPGPATSFDWSQLELINLKFNF
jgi:hypothetical protein